MNIFLVFGCLLGAFGAYLRKYLMAANVALHDRILDPHGSPRVVEQNVYWSQRGQVQPPEVRLCLHQIYLVFQQ